MLENDFRERVGYWVHITAHQYERVMNAELLSSGVTYRQCQVLAWLALDGALSQVELADRMNVEPPTVVRVLDGMERQGLVVRRPAEADRRRNVVMPLPKAQPIWEKIMQCADRVNERAMLGLSAEQEETLRHLLTIVHQNLTIPETRTVSRDMSTAAKLPAAAQRSDEVD